MSPVSHPCLIIALRHLVLLGRRTLMTPCAVQSTLKRGALMATLRMVKVRLSATTTGGSGDGLGVGAGVGEKVCRHVQQEG